MEPGGLEITTFCARYAAAQLPPWSLWYWYGWDWAVSVDLITIGVLMLLVPGVALTNAMWEIVAGDTYSGISRTAEAILAATAIALGAAVGLGIGRIL